MAGRRRCGTFAACQTSAEHQTIVRPSVSHRGHKKKPRWAQGCSYLTKERLISLPTNVAGLRRS